MVASMPGAFDFADHTLVLTIRIMYASAVMHLWL